MRTLIIFYFICICCALNAQDIKGQDCYLLKKVVELERFKDHFFIDRLRDSNIVFIDTAGYFKDCSFLTSYKKNVSVSRNWPSYIRSPSKGNSLEAKGKFVLFHVERKKKKYKLNIWEPLNNGSLDVQYKIRRKSVKILKVSWGVY